jgi:hypothetical protein
MPPFVFARLALNRVFQGQLIVRRHVHGRGLVDAGLIFVGSSRRWAIRSSRTIGSRRWPIVRALRWAITSTAPTRRSVVAVRTATTKSSSVRSWWRAHRAMLANELGELTKLDHAQLAVVIGVKSLEQPLG